MNNAPIFILGVPRSGTTLLAAMLAAHSRISCGPETHFFRKLASVDVEKLVSRSNWPQEALAFVCSIQHTSYSEAQSVPLLQKYCLVAEQIDAYLREKEPSIPNILASVTEQYMQAMGKSRWAEKTPDHLLCLRQVRQHFPDSPIIRIIRDPRDVAISLTKVPWGAMSYLEALLLWKRMDEASDSFFQTDPLSYTLQYERLITAPEDELTRLCRFIGEEFEPGMLDTSVTGKQLNARRVPWKEKVSQPIDPNHRAIWKSQLSRQDNQLAEAILGGRLQALGYPIEGDYPRLAELYPSLALAQKYPVALKALASDGIRFWKADDDEKPAVRIYLGDPIDDGWLKGDRLHHLLGATSILAELVKARLSGQRLSWIAGEEANGWSGFSAFFLKKILAGYRYTESNHEAGLVHAGSKGE
jgi:hypothetical protein